VRLRNRLITLFFALAAAIAPAVVLTAPAQAATVGNVYISFPKWEGNCPNGGSVQRIWASDGLQTWNWDAGDDLIYGKVYLGVTNSIQYELFCQTTWYGLGYYQPGTWTNFVPTRNGQTIWVGPWGWTRN
jgi:hypothetical protein